MTTKLSDPEEWWLAYFKEYEHRSWTDYRHLLSEYVRYATSTPLLDVGCGYGFLVECARQFGIPAIGLEGSEMALSRSTLLHPLADVRAWKGGQNLPIPNESIGAAVLNEFIDHITFEQNKLLFNELWRVLKPSGLLIIKSPSKYNRFDKDEGHLTFFSPTGFCRFVNSFPFDVLDQPYVPQPIFGGSRWASYAIRCITKIYKPERWAARIDLIARKRES